MNVYQLFRLRSKAGTLKRLRMRSGGRIFTSGMDIIMRWQLWNDWDCWKRAEMIRVGPVHYNTLDEIEQFGEVLKKVVSSIRTKKTSSMNGLFFWL